MFNLMGMPFEGRNIDFDEIIRIFLADDPNNHGPAPADDETINNL